MTTPTTPRGDQPRDPIYDLGDDTVSEADTRRTATPVDDPTTVRQDDVVVDRDGEVVERRDVVVDRDDAVIERQEAVAERQHEEFGGFKFGAAFFGWLAATGTAVLLTSLVAGAGAAIGLGVTGDDAADAAAENAETIGIVGAIALAVVLFVAYFAGGYVAGRMARFDGAKQGLAVWLWALVVAVVVAIVGALAGTQFNILANLNTFPRIPINEGDLTLVGIVTAVVVAAVSLLAAVLGGIVGVRYHRRIDRVGIDR